jgi:hypothetical protein
MEQSDLNSDPDPIESFQNPKKSLFIPKSFMHSFVHPDFASSKLMHSGGFTLL